MSGNNSAKQQTADAGGAQAVPPPTSMGRPPTSQLFSRGNLVSRRLSAGEKTAQARPSTAVRAVGYAASSSSTGQHFDQFFMEKAKQQTMFSANATLDAAKEVNPQTKYKNLEMKIVKLLESSIVLAGRGVAAMRSSGSDPGAKSVLAEALNKAKEAFSLDRTLHRFRDQHVENIFHNFDLTYAVFFNLAEQYELNEMYIEALNTYSIMTKNKMFPHVNQLKLNMGNIYFKMGTGIYPKAIKMYRMALDSVPNNLKQLRLKITENIGVLFVRMGQYADAASSFEFIMSERANIRSGIHLLLCYYAMGDIEKIKSTFRNFVCSVEPTESDSDLENENNIIKLQQQADQAQSKQTAEVSLIGADAFGMKTAVTTGGDDSPGMAPISEKAGEKNRYVLQALKTDELALYMKQRNQREKRAITMLVELISPIIEENYNDGYNWCIEVIKTSNMSWLAHELELNKALVYLRQNEINQAIETLQIYNRKSEGSMTASALINLCFIYINLGNLDMATHCVNQLQELGVLQSNPMALVNASIVDMQKGNLNSARDYLGRALQLQPFSFEANYNFGLLALQEHNYALAEEQFELLRAQLMEPHSAQHGHIYYQLAMLQERRQTGGGSDFKFGSPGVLQAYLQVLGISAVDIDSRLFEKVGSLYEQIQDHQEANQYYNEAYRINPSDINIASSIGSYYIKLQATEKALYYYERAVLADPNDPNLMLRIASCFRNSYLPPKQYLGMFEKIYSRFPDNLTCVRALMQVTKSLGLSDLHDRYALDYARLQKQQLERQNEQRYQQQRISSAASGRGSSRLKSECMPQTYLYLHVDPLGPPAERPRTGMIRPDQGNDSDDDADMNAESLLPI
ncbi:intraflagellar transport protein 88 homolog [Scaptodrosophila lebanonensis]|uniref:Intraflagellar transport protein 88 homolog n=1 Tax=Drosophila lebanonensis TaxID=7225 RepID=A0A6J2T321_DROLE|nr:intraflagellar transport protein 88 homolog [Scaptodrosophila lebanonensis]